MKQRTLRAGEYIRIGDAVWRVVRVTACSAAVEPVDQRRVRFVSGSRQVPAEVEFKAPGRLMHISPTSEVPRVDPAMEESMAKSKEKSEKAPKKAKAPKTDGPMMTFAFRLPPEESKAIHAAAGPGGASRFARAVLVAAARGDLGAVEVAITDARAKA